MLCLLRLSCEAPIFAPGLFRMSNDNMFTNGAMSARGRLEDDFMA